MKSFRVIALSALIISLPACGGSGSGVSSTPAPTPLPTPIPPPPPTPPPAPPPPTPPPPPPAPPPVVLAPVVGQTANTSFSSHNGQYVLSYDAIAKTYNISENHSTPLFSQTFGIGEIVSGDTNFTNFQRVNSINAAYTDKLSLFVPGAANTKLALTYSSYGILLVGLKSVGGTINERTVYFTFGLNTATFPKAAIATYSGIVDGSTAGNGNRVGGTSLLTADFLNDTIKLLLDLNFTANPNYNALPSVKLGGQGFFDPVNNNISGQLTSTSNAIDSGSFTGSFYGPNHDEFGIDFATHSVDTIAHPTTAPLYNIDGVAVGTLNTTTANPVGETLDASTQAGSVFFTADNAITLGGSSGNFSLLPSTITYDSTSGKYTLQRDSRTNLGNSGYFAFGTADLVNGPANYNTYKVNDSRDPSSTSRNVTIGLFKTGAANTQLALTYTSYGFYNFPTVNPTATSIDNYVFFQYGNMTPYNVFPTTGTASYNGIVDGIFGNPTGTYRLAGTSTLNANFGTQSLTTRMSFTGTNLASGGPSLPSQTFSGAASINGAAQGANFQYNGGLTSASNPGVSGQFFGNFFGPTANEYGYSFRIFNGTTSANSTVFGIGVAVGKK